MSTYFDQLRNLYFSYRHIGDEPKAYDTDAYIRFMWAMDEAFSTLYRVNLETGNVTIRPGCGEADYQAMIAKLENLAAQMTPLHDPNLDKIPLWDGQNIPWHHLNAQQWAQISHDGPDFTPHLVPYLQKDGKRHPAVLITGGSYRHFTEQFPFAEFYHQQGYHAFLLHTRHGIGEPVRHSLNRALDLQRAVRLLRAKAGELAIDPDRIFTNGSSMGNRPTIDLINTLGVCTAPERIDPAYLPDEIDRLPARLNAYVSVYPATFAFDRQNNYADFPPTFFVLGNKDFSLWRMMPFISDLAAHDVRVEAHLYDGVVHGFGLGDNRFRLCGEGERVLAAEEWTHLLLLWLDRVFAAKSKG